MKKARKGSDALRPEYDFASMKGGVRGKYVNRLREGSNLVLLEPDIAAAFKSDAAVNKTLRAALDVASAVSTPDRRTRTARVPAKAKERRGPRRAAHR